MQPKSQKSLSIAQVYVIQNEIGLVKIGFANKPDKRIDSIAANSGLKIIARHVSPPCFNFTDVEKQLHQHFSLARKHGEWFDIPFENAVDALNAHFTTPENPDNQALVSFNFQDHPLRTLQKNGETWFCLKDACDILDIDNSRNVSNRLTEKGVCSIDMNTSKGIHQLTFVNEPNLYRVIFRSDKPQAKAFQNWVFEEVLPSIRKTGGYGQCVLNPEFQSFIRATVANEVNAALQDKIKQKHIKLNSPDNGVPSCLVDFINQSIEKDKRYDTKLVFEAFIKLYPTYKYIKQRTFTKWLLLSFSPIVRTKSCHTMYFRIIGGAL